jgi:hypothetical protein
MNITILNGNPNDGDGPFHEYVGGLSTSLSSVGHEVNTLPLRDLHIRHCTGCFGCWVRTPGRCVQDDDMPIVHRAAINADLLVFASPVIMGFPSALLKKTVDRIIPLVHPYVVIDQGELHHLARYDRYPPLALLLDKGVDGDDEDIEIISDIFQRTARNFKTRLAFTWVLDTPIKDVVDEINRL